MFFHSETSPQVSQEQDGPGQESERNPLQILIKQYLKVKIGTVCELNYPNKVPIRALLLYKCCTGGTGRQSVNL